MSKPVTFDPVWEERYAAGHQQRAPWDEVVSFIFRHAPKDRPRGAVKILEVGCGTASNLWFAAMEGFDVYGLEGSASAVETAKKRFAEDKLKGDLRAGDFTDLPYEDAFFDMVIDRGALTCCGTSAMKKAIGEVHRVLKTGGRFLYTPYSDTHSGAAASEQGPDGIRININKGGLSQAGQIRFVSRQEIDQFIEPSRWRTLSLERVEATDILTGDVVSYWRAVVAKL